MKRGQEVPQDQFAALSEAIHEGRLNLVEAGKLADTGRVKFSTILQAQEAAYRAAQDAATAAKLEVTMVSSDELKRLTDDMKKLKGGARTARD